MHNVCVISRMMTRRQHCKWLLLVLQIKPVNNRSTNTDAELSEDASAASEGKGHMHMVRMKTERKYFEPIVFVFYIMILFSNLKNISFNWFYNYF
jgi:hypothetical protein